MLKKLSQFIASFFSSKKLENPENYYIAPKIAPNWEEHEEHKKSLATSGVAEKIAQQEEQQVEVDLATGKIVFPENMSAEERKEIEASLKELTESLQKFAPEELYASLEDFMKNAGTEVKIWDGLTTVNEMEDSLTKVKEEMEFCEENTEHWNDTDFASALYEFESQGYEFKDIDNIYRKINDKLELTETEKKHIRECYKLATQEHVYAI